MSGKKVLISITYEKSVSMKIISDKKRKNIKDELRKIRDTDEVWCFKHKKFCTIMFAKDLLKNIKVEKDHKKIEAFTNLFGKTFNSADVDIFNSIFRKLKKYKTDEKERQKEEERKEEEQKERKAHECEEENEYKKYAISLLGRTKSYKFDTKFTYDTEWWNAYTISRENNPLLESLMIDKADKETKSVKNF